MTRPVAWRQIRAFPDPLRLHCLAPERFPFFLESAVPENGPRPPSARFDLLLGDPGSELRAGPEGGITLDGEPLGEDFLTALARIRAERDPGRPVDFPGPFWGGFFVYMAYEEAAELEKLPAPKGAYPGPRALAVEMGAAVIRDHYAGQTLVVACGEHAEARVANLADRAEATAREPWRGDPELPGVADEADPGEYTAAVASAREYIRAGDVFQVNLARAWTAQAPAPPDPSALYDRLRRANPAPFAGMARLPGGPVIHSSSPERLLAVSGDRAETRPIAGTRPRAAGESEDAALSAELRRHPKERAEHVMLIDLERNDLGRVCVPGTVTVDELMALETFAHVHHITSNVCGQLSPGQGTEDALRALFPGGTITGCPKVRCQEIIHELEPRPRGPYTGTMGYLAFDGTADFNILIRALVQDGTRLELLTGAGIVADSDPDRELAETRTKARGLLRIFDTEGD